MKIKEILWLSLISISSLTFGVLYSIYNTDPHHWGFILGTALDYIHGKSLFTQIYIQYGIGEPILFKFLNSFLTINYTSIGVITSVAYTLNLLLIYFSLKSLGSRSLAILLGSIAFLMHSYCIYPWPDYYAGLSIASACFIFIQYRAEKSWLPYLFAGVFLFAATLFRSTYLPSITLAGACYLVVATLFKNTRNRNLIIALGTFGFLGATFLLLLRQQGLLSLWNSEAVGAASAQYGIGFDAIFLLLKRAFLPAKFWLPNNLVNTSFTVLFYFSIYTLFRLLFKPASGLFIFFGLLGLSGLAQATLGYEPFRLINACSPLFLLAAYSIQSKSRFEEGFYKNKKVLAGLALYFVLMIVKFPNASSIYPVHDGAMDTFQPSVIPIYSGHRFQQEETEYYNSLAASLCDGRRRILNRTMDSSIPYLCPGQQNAVALPFFFPPMIENLNPEEVREEKTGDFKEDEEIVADAPLVTNPKVKLVTVGTTFYPHKLRYIGHVQVTVYHVERVDSVTTKR